MEEKRIVIARLDMLQEIVAMKRRLVEELHNNVAPIGLKDDFATHFLFFVPTRCDDKRCNEYQQQSQSNNFHIYMI